MDVESQVTLITTIGALIVALIPVVLKYMRARGLEIDERTERIIRDAAAEGVRFAEEFARRDPKSGSEKLALATLHANRLLAKHGINVRLDELGDRVQAQIPAQFPSRNPPAKLSGL